MYKRSEVEKNALEFFKDSLVANVWLDKYALKLSDDEYIENHPNDTIIRISRELHRIEQTYKNPMSCDEIYDLLKDYNKFVLGGSCLFGIGNDLTLSTLGNCFAISSPVDSYAGIFRTDQELAQLMKRRGGVGTDISSIRPRHSKVSNAASTSTGIIPFMTRFSNTTREVAQEGRRGALMISLDINHPDIEEFITSKDDLSKITGANISVKVTDEFMSCVEKDENYSLLFPTEPIDDSAKVEVVIKAKFLWNKLIHQAWKNAEPGILFWDKIISESPADCYEKFGTVATNPCSELPLCPYDSCRLSAINLCAYVRDPFTEDTSFDFEILTEDTRKFQRLMDNIIDLENEKIIAIRNKIANDPEDWDLKLPEYELWYKIQNKLLWGRRTGLGQMGLADAGAALGLKYGSPEFIEFAEMVNRKIATSSYESSINMAKERGAFPVWQYDKEKDNPYINRIYDAIVFDSDGEFPIGDYKEHGRRNIANLTIAPTGTISMLAGVSSGIEPVFALSYTRKRKVSADNPNKKIQDKQGDWWEEYEVKHPKFQEWIKNNGVAGLMNIGDFNTHTIMPVDRWALVIRDKEISNPSLEECIRLSPYYGSTAHEIDPYTKLKLQSVIQPWIDHSISVTYNLPRETTEEQISKLYFDAWKLGLKGLTVYRDGSREGILTINKPTTFNQYDAPKRPRDLYCDVYNIMAKGRPWKVFIGLLDNLPYEVFAVDGKLDKIPIEHGVLRKVQSGRYDLVSLEGDTIIEDITHNMTQEEEAFTRMVSWALRHGAKLNFGIEQLNKSEGDITSFAKAIARTLKRYCKDGSIRGTACPDCGEMMVSEGGCWICKNCLNNKCD